MRCPYCAGENTQVKDSRPTEENAAIRRRRDLPRLRRPLHDVRARAAARADSSSSARAARCPSIATSSMRSVDVALRKRPIDRERVERMVSGLVRQLESAGESEVASSTIGGLVMEALRGLDPVAYVRFASVYRDFREAADFHEVLGEIAAEPVAAHEARAHRLRELRRGDGAAQEALSVHALLRQRAGFDAHMMADRAAARASAGSGARRPTRRSARSSPMRRTRRGDRARLDGARRAPARRDRGHRAAPARARAAPPCT